MGLLNLLLGGVSRLGWGGGSVPSNRMSKVLPNPPGSRHDTYSLDGNPNIQSIGAGFVPPKPAPTSLDEGDILNTSTYRNASGKKYKDNLPK
jgi:hypothetical protein